MSDAKRQKEQYLTLLEASPKQQAPCPHFNEGCGGCVLQEYSYAEQLAAKRQFLTQLYGKDIPIHAADAPLGYRSRMDYVVAFEKMGLRKRGQFAQVVDITDCHLLPQKTREIYKQARAILLGSGLTPYNYVRHEGFLRYLVIRNSVTTGQTMLIITTVAPKDDAQRTHVHTLLARLLEQTGVTSVHWTINNGLGDISVGTPLLYVGAEQIIDTIGDARFLIAPQTFFQGNPAMAGTLFADALRHVEGRVLDLYCGVGVITILAAKQSGTPVVGVELNEESIRMAHKNRELNRLDSQQCAFVAADAAKYLVSSRERFDTVLCDPARPGLGRETCALLLAKRPKKIIYISCNPLTHKEDLSSLARDYHVQLLEAYDLFPQTPHIEILSVLARKVRKA